MSTALQQHVTPLRAPRPAAKPRRPKESHYLYVRRQKNRWQVRVWIGGGRHADPSAGQVNLGTHPTEWRANEARKRITAGAPKRTALDWWRAALDCGAAPAALLPKCVERRGGLFVGRAKVNGEWVETGPVDTPEAAHLAVVAAFRAGDVTRRTKTLRRLCRQRGRWWRISSRPA